MPHDEIIGSQMEKVMSDEHESTTTAEPEAPANETKAEKFKRIGSYRLTQARARIKLLSHCTNSYTYEYTPEQVTKIVTLLRSDIDELERAFSGKQKEDLSVEL